MTIGAGPYVEVVPGSYNIKPTVSLLNSPETGSGHAQQLAAWEVDKKSRLKLLWFFYRLRIFG